MQRVPPVAADATMAVAIVVLDIIELAFFSDGAPVPSPWAILLFAAPCLGLVAEPEEVGLGVDWGVIGQSAVCWAFAARTLGPAGGGLPTLSEDWANVLQLWIVAPEGARGGQPAPRPGWGSRRF